MDINKLKSIVNKSRLINEKVEGKDFSKPEIDRNFFENENATFELPKTQKRKVEQPTVMSENVQQSNRSPFLERVKQSFEKLPPQTGEGFNPYTPKVDLSELTEGFKPKKQSQSMRESVNSEIDLSSIISELKKEIKNIVKEQLDDIIDQKIKEANKEIMMNEQIQLRVGNTLFLGNITKQKPLKTK